MSFQIEAQISASVGDVFRDCAGDRRIYKVVQIASRALKPVDLEDTTSGRRISVNVDTLLFRFERVGWIAR